MASIHSEDLSAEVMEILENYSADVRKAVAGAVKETGEKVLKTVKKKSPVSKGKKHGSYRRGWKMDVATTGVLRLDSTVTIYNKKHGPLVHILEDGHQKKDGGRVEGIPHVRPSYQEAERLLPELVEKAIEEVTGG